VLDKDTPAEQEDGGVVDPVRRAELVDEELAGVVGAEVMVRGATQARRASPPVEWFVASFDESVCVHDDRCAGFDDDVTFTTVRGDTDAEWFGQGAVQSTGGPVRSDEQHREVAGRCVGEVTARRVE
jgi:hypothetical protein